MTSLYDLPPRIELDFTSLDGDTVTITRRDALGNTAPVRSANPAPIVDGEWIGYDYECPFGIEVWFTATTNTGHTETAGPLSLGVQECWLIHPGLPLMSQRVVLAPIGDKTSPVSTGVHYVLERQNALVVSDGTRHGPTFTVRLKTDTFEDADALRNLLGDGSVLLLQQAWPFTERREYQWISVGDVVETDLTDDVSEPSKRWTLSCTVTDAPAGTLQATWTWQDLIDNYPTWQDVIDAFPTWRDVITNSPAS